MVSYEDILYPLNLGYGLREIYDLAPWAFDLLIFALVLSAIFKPAMEKLPMFASKKDESHKLAGILALIFSGSTVYWMQVQNTNLAAAAPYMILILFAILGIFVYQLIAATEWGKKHKFFSGALAFFITTGLCQALFGVGDIFTDVFPIFNALFVFFARILIWVILITAIITLLGRFGNKDGEGGGSGGGSPSGGSPSSSGGVGFWNKAKSWIPYKLRSPSGRKEIDLKEYEKNASNLELEMEEANKCAKDLDKILQFQASAIEKLKKFFKDLPAWLDQIEVYFKKQNSLPPKPANDIVRFADRITEFSEAFNATIQTIKAEFDKLKTINDTIKKDILEFETKLKESSKNIISYVDVLQTQSDFFKGINDEKNLGKLAVVQGKISDLSSKNDALSIQFKKLEQNFDEANKLFPDVLKTDLVQKIERLKNFLELTNAALRKLLNQPNPAGFSTVITVLKDSVSKTITYASDLDKTAKEVLAKNKRFLEINTAMEKSIAEIRNTLQELSDLDTSINGELTSSAASIVAIEEKKAEEDKVKKAQAEQERTARETAGKQRVQDVNNYVKNLEQLKTIIGSKKEQGSLQGYIGAFQSLVGPSGRKKYSQTVVILEKEFSELNDLNVALQIELIGETAEFKQQKKKLQLHIKGILNLLQLVIVDFGKIIAAKESKKEDLEIAALDYLEDLNEILTKYKPQEIDTMIGILKQPKSKKK